MFIIAKNDQKASQKITILEKKYDEVISLNDRISLDVADVINHHETTRAAYNRIYYVSDGLMNVHINSEMFSLRKGDACFIEKGMIFELRGTFSVIIVSNPSLQL